VRGKIGAVLVFLYLLSLPLLVAATPLVTLNVQDTEIVSVLQSLARIGGKNIAISQEVSGKVTANMKGVPFDSALDIITKLKGLSYQMVGDVIVVSPSSRMGKDFGEFHVFKLNYAQAEELLPTVQLLCTNGATAAATPAVGAAGQPAGAAAATTAERLRVDKATNSMVFVGTQAEANQIRSLLAELDIAYQQVSLEAQVLSISKSASKELGVEWQWKSTPTYPTVETDSGTTTVTREVNWGTIKYGRSPAGIPYEFYYSSTINALVTKGDAEVLARPKVTTLNGKEAIINIGDEVPITVTTTSNNVTTTSTEYRKVGIILKYTPRINVDGQITAAIHTEVSSPVWDTDSKAYRFTTRSADTQVRLQDGETMVIGGLIGKEESRAFSKVPGLSALPIVGSLFKNLSKSRTDNEVVIFVTARVVK